MSTINVPIPAQTWTQITTADKSGSIYHKSGNDKIVYVEAETTPPDYTAGSPILDITSKHESLTYFNVPTLDFIWAWSESDAIASVTPVGV